MESVTPKETKTTAIKIGEGSVQIASSHEEDATLLRFTLEGHTSCILHWGLCRRPGSGWMAPPEEIFPEKTRAVEGGKAAETELTEDKPLAIRIHKDLSCRVLAFVLHDPENAAWIKDNGSDFQVELPAGAAGMPSPLEILKDRLQRGEEAEEISLDHGYSLAWALRDEEEALILTLACTVEAPVLLHWGLAPRFRHQWRSPDKAALPEGSTLIDDKAARTPFVPLDGGGGILELTIQKNGENGPRGINFILYQPEDEEWIKASGRDIYLTLTAGEESTAFQSSAAREISEEIVSAETGHSSWTLMHRFNLCHDLVERAGDNEEAWSLLFVWLRYSAMRQLDWQRNYNTKPRDLAHAQDRLTRALARAWHRETPCRPWIRLLLSTLGRGGDGQIVRDEILNIMHRHHLKEVRETFMEEWHQKLHNNTTPDDVVICEAYLAFMHSGGNRDDFYRVLEENGVTRERLAGFERPIVTDPIFHGDKAGGLIHDFQNYLQILKRVHTGADFDAAVGHASGRFDDELRHTIGEVQHLKDSWANHWDQVRAVTRARSHLRGRLEGEGDEEALRDLLYLDLGLEVHLRTVIEQLSGDAHSRDAGVEAVSLVLENVIISTRDPEFKICLNHWNRLKDLPHDGREWALHAKSVADRISRRLGERTADFYDTVQPKAEYLGSAFEADDWVIPLFSEEMIRGGELFVLSLLMRHLDKILREAAGIGGWQIISPGEGWGRVHFVEDLHGVQGSSFCEATILIADRVSGDEEIPEGVTTVITSDCPDLVSHVAVRARNMKVLLAACFDQEVYTGLKDLEEKQLILTLRGDDLEIEEGSREPGAQGGQRAEIDTTSVKPRDFTTWAVPSDNFTREIVGGKSNNLVSLQGKLPDWIHLPASAAVPFGACEKVLAEAPNSEVKAQLESLEEGLNESLEKNAALMREAMLALTPPEALKTALMDVLTSVGFSTISWDQAWTAVKRVWGAKWNDRAILSRRALGLKHSQLAMAVLIQEIVKADYAFVIHTVNPLSGEENEIYAEVVLGMGETLVGNYPGRSLSFTCNKKSGEIHLLSYPGKSEGIYSSGVIFRSDSNGEDLEGFAGAGLYDSYPAADPEHRLLDYSDEPLVWDANFRTGLLKRIADAALAVEAATAVPQDIEGAISGDTLYIVQTRAQVGLG